MRRLWKASAAKERLLTAGQVYILLTDHVGETVGPQGLPKPELFVDDTVKEECFRQIGGAFRRIFFGGLGS